MAKVLVIGSGGREHALGWKLAQSDAVDEVLYAPGNGGTQEGKGRNVSIDGTKKENFDALAELIERERIAFTVVGPEAPLVDGLADFLRARGHPVFGPSAAAARLESDKFFSYDVMAELGIPQAAAAKCHTTEDAIRAIRELANGTGIVIKARGLTGGKGVVVCDSKERALREIAEHGRAFGPEVLISERLFGEEFSVFGICDGRRVWPIELSLQDHKRALDGDNGPNTGGMGAYGPATIAPREIVREVAEKVMTPVMRYLRDRGTPYTGFLYAGMMLTCDGPKALEFNVRFGDPECQPAMLIIKDLYEPLASALEGRLDKIAIEFNPGAACCVVLASRGYPSSYAKGLPIAGVEAANSIPGVKVFHAGTAKDAQGRLVTSGGRVLGVTAYSPDGIAAAQRLAYKAAAQITVEGGFHYRKDIASKALADQERR